MSFDVRPCADTREFIDAFSAIGQYFGAEPTEERMERFLKNLPLTRMFAAREDGQTVGGAVLERRVQVSGREQRREVLDRLLARCGAEEMEERREPFRDLLRPAGPDLDLRQAIFSSGA